ncbi:heterokaryon incompatibility protein-domain-containing protein [Leptodontidium sp. MPI-SDFR-AT-0119]|nr:heterokaryon incompatibility protein-domain-containing protein [Leptodontidium sp. MPI-SDFR-AT-0119]
MADLTSPSSSQDLDSYKYQEIPSENTIRILTLSPGPPGARLEGNLEFASLDDYPEYEAISYVWGDPTRCEEIIIEGKPLGLTQSIADALRRMRHETEPRRLWADQICIEQDDLVERGHQVKLMGAIYKNTEKVLVWLGQDEKNHAKRALNQLETLQKVFKNRQLFEQFTEVQKVKLETFTDRSWWSLREFYLLPWFERVWIGQEAGTAAPMELFWGQEMFEWKTLFFVSRIMEKFHKPLRVHFNLNVSVVTYLDGRFIPSEDRKSHESKDPRTSLVYELNRASERKSTDPRDRVFAMLGHFSAAVLLEDSTPFEADYTRSTRDIYIDVAVRTLKGYPRLELLNSVQWHDDDDESLPSWVADWGNNSIRNLLGRRDALFHAAGDSAHSFSIRENQPVLSIKGLQIDAIERVSNELKWTDFDFKHLHGGHASDCVSLGLWTEICQIPEFNLEHCYVNGEGSVLAFCQALTAGCLNIRLEHYRDIEYESVPSATWLQYGAAYLTGVFGSGGLVDDAVREAAFCDERRFFRTALGYYGIGPCELENDDLIVVLFGGTTPYVLRPTSEGYKFVGECYVYGLMNGEAILMMEREELKEKTFDLR